MMSLPDHMNGQGLNTVQLHRTQSIQRIQSKGFRDILALSTRSAYFVQVPGVAQVLQVRCRTRGAFRALTISLVHGVYPLRWKQRSEDLHGWGTLSLAPVSVRMVCPRSHLELRSNSRRFV